METKVTIQIVTFNNQDDILDCLRCVFNQKGDFKFEVCVIDNNSTDATVELVIKYYPLVHLIRLNRNLGYAGGHNLGIRTNKNTDFVLTLNPDVQLEPSYIQQILDSIDKSSSFGMASGFLLRPDYETIDSAGIGIHKNRRPYDILQGKSSINNRFEELNQIRFGPCGAAAIYRKAFINDMMIGSEFFDEDFFVYKEDVDVCWRGQLYGWNALFIPTAIAVHKRGWKKDSRKHINSFVKYHSFKNRYLLMMKNDDLINFFFHLPWIIGFEIAAFIFILLNERNLINSFYGVLKLMNSTLKKRRIIMKKRRRTSKELRYMFH